MITITNIANHFNVSASYISMCLSGKNGNGARVKQIREYAEQIGYKSVAERKEAAKKERAAHTWWKGGCFHEREEERSRMLELRADGYSNKEIAKKVGRTAMTVRRNIGSQPAEMTKVNRQTAQHIRAYKSAARKMAVSNTKIAAYNEKVERHNKIKVELALLEKDLLKNKPNIEAIAAAPIAVPPVDLHAVQPTALM